jgi:hypothetical protein
MIIDDCWCCGRFFSFYYFIFIVITIVIDIVVTIMPLHTFVSILWHSCYSSTDQFYKYERFQAREDHRDLDHIKVSIWIKVLLILLMLATIELQECPDKYYHYYWYSDDKFVLWTQSIFLIYYFWNFMKKKRLKRNINKYLWRFEWVVGRKMNC